MKAKPRQPGRPIKSVAFLAMTMAVALTSALLIVYSLTQAADPDPLPTVSSGQTGTIWRVEHRGPVDHSLLATPELPPEPDACSNRNAANAK